MPEVPPRAFFPSSYYTDAPLEICSKLFVRTLLEFVPLLLDERLQLGEELFDWVEVGRHPIHHRHSYLLQFLASLSSLVFQYGQQQRLILHRAQRFQDFVHQAKKNKTVLMMTMMMTIFQVATKETEAVQAMTAILAAAAAPAAVANWGYSATFALASIAWRT
jgi:hypothetical protein